MSLAAQSRWMVSSWYMEPFCLLLVPSGPKKSNKHNLIWLLLKVIHKGNKMNWFKEFVPRNSSCICLLKWYLYEFMAHANLYSMRVIVWTTMHIKLWFWERRIYEPQICESCCNSYTSIFAVCSPTLQHCLKIHTCSAVCVLVWPCQHQAGKHSYYLSNVALHNCWYIKLSVYL